MPETNSLVARLLSTNPAVRLEALREAGALSYDGGSIAQHLVPSLLHQDETVRNAAENALVRIGPAALTAIAPYFGDYDFKWPLVSLMQRLVSETLERLHKLRQGASGEVQARIDQVLSQAQPAVPTLLRSTHAGTAELMPLASRALTQLGVVAMPHLEHLLRNDPFQSEAIGGDVSQERIFVTAAEALGRIGAPAKDSLLSQLHSARRPQVRATCERALGSLGDDVTAELRALLRCEDRELKLSAARALSAMTEGGLAALKDLVKLFTIDDADLRDAAAEAVVQLLANMAKFCKKHEIENPTQYLPHESELLATIDSLPKRGFRGVISMDGEIGPVGATAILVAELARHDQKKRARAARAVYQLVRRPDVRNEDPFLIRALLRLGRRGDRVIRRLALSKALPERRLAVESYRKMSANRAARALESVAQLLADENPEVQADAARVCFKVRLRADAHVALAALPRLPQLLPLLPLMKTREQCERFLAPGRGWSPLRAGVWLIGQVGIRSEREECQAAHRALALVAMTVRTKEPLGLESALEFLETRLRE